MTMNIPYPIDVYDNIIPDSSRAAALEYVKSQNWYGYWGALPQQVFHYKLGEDTSWTALKTAARGGGLHRCTLASDEDSLKSNHLPIYAVWRQLNQQLDNCYELTGNPEDMNDNSVAPPTADPTLEQGWRVYVNGSYNTTVLNNGYTHRDTPLEHNDDTSVTMLYVLNKEWYPNWGGEIRFYPEDTEGESGDHQQFNWGFQQKRGYNVGWLDHGRIVSTVPGRLIVYDGRCLHAGSPANSVLENPSVKLVFRARKIK